ncbi:Crp/Fnr family transcriptional regulator [Flavobacteriaceae bacterium]|nr:Crp/Fnr family transcriptional regulator [Flavobacteriaceae bacterium]MDA9844078.1 Crp/Fnr family transcriptional regulator [Flavobacteriaceae bacterium]MDA9878855.1 Crp/Fnr family transcriptional regulator [Flavobacteriaceae bacterium]
MTTENIENLKFLFEKKLLEEIIEVSSLQKVTKGDIMIDVGEQVKFIPILTNGAIKVVREDESGEEILLYFVEFGNTCAMTLNCCLENSRSEIRAICEKDTTLIMVPVSQMDNWLVKYRSWRNFIFQNYQNRLNEMLKAIDSLTFLKLDERLRKYLKEKSKVADNSNITVTHLDIATDLNSSRVVISRLLKQMENDGEVSLGRNTIKINY